MLMLGLLIYTRISALLSNAYWRKGMMRLSLGCDKFIQTKILVMYSCKAGVCR